MHASTYATTSDYRNFVGGGPVPADLDRAMLTAASRRIDRTLLGAIYAVDGDGLPTDCAVAAALRDATCAQVEDWIETGDNGTGSGATVSDVQIGSVRIGRAAGAPGNQPGGIDVARKALDILSVAGLYPVHPWLVG